MTPEAGPSRTALITCLMRGLHSRFDRPALIEDGWADRLVTAEEREALAGAVMSQATPDERARRLATEGADAILHSVWRRTSVYAGVIIRTRYTEERVLAAALRGVRQYVVIGAGLDSFGLMRGPATSHVHVFEVDRPASQEFKRRRLADCGAEVPPGLQFVAADLASEGLDSALARSSFRFDEPAIFSWLGVTMYLTRETNLATLKSIAELAATGSELVFTYIEQQALDSDSPAMRRLRTLAAAAGEPWLSGFDSLGLPGQLAELGLEMIEDVGGAELRERYCRNRGDGLLPGRAGRIAFVRVHH